MTGSHERSSGVSDAAAPGRAIRELPPAERPRERLALRGVGGLTTAELIGLVWGSGTRGRSAVDLASDALVRHDGLTGLARASELELAALSGVGGALRSSGQYARPFEVRWGSEGPRTDPRRTKARSTRSSSEPSGDACSRP